MSCNGCESYTCANDVFECLSTLTLGTVPNLSSVIYVHVVKQNGAEYIHTVISSGAGLVTIDMTEPDPEFYSSRDGLYVIWATVAGYYNSDDRLTITDANGETATAIGVKFRQAQSNPFLTQHIELIP